MLGQNLINRITSEVSQRVQALLGHRLRNIILFGSCARGDYNDESDVDIMVLADFDESEISVLRNEISLISNDVSLENDITVCILLYNNQFFESHLHISPFYRNVKNEGVVLYAS